MTELRRVHGFHLPKRWPTQDELTEHQARIGRMLASPPPPPTVLGVPTIKDQEDTGECFGFGAVQGIHIRRQARGEVSSILSPALPYWGARRETVANDTDVTDSGSDPDGMIAALADFGACAWDEDPFDAAKVNARPNDTAFLAAQQHRCTLVPILSTGSQLYAAIQHVIAVERKPVLVALQVVPAFDNVGSDGVIDDPTGTSRGLHAQCLYGFDGVGSLDANSWGLSWGRSGCSTLTSRFIAGAVVWAGSLEINP